MCELDRNIFQKENKWNRKRVWNKEETKQLGGFTLSPVPSLLYQINTQLFFIYADISTEMTVFSVYLSVFSDSQCAVWSIVSQVISMTQWI